MAEGDSSSWKLDKIGCWTEIKLEIIRKYAAVYSRILSKQKNLSHVYIDGFCGSGIHESRTTGDLVEGSPVVALSVDPPFNEYHFIDLDYGKTETLGDVIKSSAIEHVPLDTIYIYEDDCNEVLLEKVYPRVKYADYKRALCLLDPYGLHLSWDVIYTAGQMKSIEIFLNFPIGDMNRNVLRRDPEKTTAAQAARMTKYWGDESWKEAAYSCEKNLFGFPEKESNEAVVNAFRNRLTDVAGYSFVPEPLPMRNNKGAVVYYLFFASPNDTGARIVKDIFSRYRDRRS